MVETPPKKVFWGCFGGLNPFLAKSQETPPVTTVRGVFLGGSAAHRPLGGLEGGRRSPPCPGVGGLQPGGGERSWVRSSRCFIHLFLFIFLKGGMEVGLMI